MTTEPAQNQPTVTKEHHALREYIIAVWNPSALFSERVRARKEIDSLIAAAEARAVEIAIENASAATIHSCSDACQRPMCVLRRENKALTAKLALAERYSKEVRAAYKRLHSQIGGYLHGEQWDHWQAYNEPRYAPDAAMQPEGGK